MEVPDALDKRRVLAAVMEVAALLGEIAGGVQWGCILYHRVALSFLFPYQVREYLDAERKADTPPPKRARMAQSGPRECAEMQEKKRRESLRLYSKWYMAFTQKGSERTSILL